MIYPQERPIHFHINGLFYSKCKITQKLKDSERNFFYLNLIDIMSQVSDPAHL